MLGQKGRGEAAEAEEHRMADGDLAGEAHQDVQPQRRDSQVADLNQEAQQIAGEDQRREGQRHHAGGAAGHGEAGGEQRLVGAVAGAIIAAGARGVGGHGIRPSRCRGCRTGRTA